MNKKTESYICLLTVAILFGLSYVFQTEAAKYVGPFTFGFFRYLLATLCMIPFLFKKDNISHSEYLKGGFILALCFLAASGAQQSAAGKTESGKLGFITSMYIVLVPLAEYFIYRKKMNKAVIFSVVLSVIGLGLLCGITSLEFNVYDFVVLIAAIAYALEIIYIDRKAEAFDQNKLMFYAFVISALLFFICGLIFEGLKVSNYEKIIIPVGYLGIVAGAIGYCLQVVGQKNTEGTVASVLMSLESVVSVLAGIIILNESFTLIQLLGCLLMFTAATLSTLKGN